MFALEHVHPMLVHFPIVFFISLAAFDTMAFLRAAPVTGRSVAGSISTGLAVLAGLSALAAMLFGDMALETAVAGGFDAALGETHEGLGTTTALVFAVWALLRVFAWWRNRRGSPGMDAGIAAIEIVGAVLVIVTAYYGGELVYNLGVNVARAAVGG